MSSKSGVQLRRVAPSVSARAPRLRLALRPSRIGCAWVTSLCVLSAGLLVAVPLPLTALVFSAIAVAGVLVSGLWRCTGRGVPALMHVGHDRRITVTDYDGRSRAGTILDDTFVGASITTIVWRCDGLAWWRPAPAIIVLPDMLSSDEFRRLRVALRYGRPAARGTTSDDDASRPASHC